MRHSSVVLVNPKFLHGHQEHRTIPLVFHNDIFHFLHVQTSQHSIVAVQFGKSEHVPFQFMVNFRSRFKVDIQPVRYFFQKIPICWNQDAVRLIICMLRRKVPQIRLIIKTWYQTRMLVLGLTCDVIDVIYSVYGRLNALPSSGQAFPF